MASTKATQHTYRNAWRLLGLTRIVVGFIFLWAFLDKTFGLGFSTKAASAWINGASPTSGFLTKGVNPESPFAGFFNGLAGNVGVDLLFMLGLLGIGVALLCGTGLRIAAVAGSVLLLMMWAAELPLKNNPAIDDHVVYATLLWVFAASKREFSIADWWIKQPFVKKNPWLW